MSRRRPAAAPSVTWRDGVALTGTPIWCDARRRRDVCFVSSADRIGRAGHGQLIATAPTLALLGSSGDGDLSVPLRRRFTLGTLRLELVPSGRGLGAAALLVDINGKQVLYAGAIRRDGPEPAEVRTCDAVCVSAPFGEPHHVFAKIAAIADEVADWTRARAAAGERAVLVVDTALDGLEVASELVARGVEVGASRAIRDAATRAGSAAPTLVPARIASAIVRVASERSPASDSGARPIAARVSGYVVDGAGADGAMAAQFAWSSAAGRAELLAWIEETHAREVFVTGAGADAIAAALGPRARVLGPPQQMALFEAS